MAEVPEVYKCPFCNAEMEVQAKVCPDCKRFSRPTGSKVRAETSRTGDFGQIFHHYFVKYFNMIAPINSAISGWEARNAKAISRGLEKAKLPPFLKPLPRMFLGVMIVSYSVFLITTRPTNDDMLWLYDLLRQLALCVVGLALITWPWIKAADEVQNIEKTYEESSPNIWIFGKGINILLVQSELFIYGLMSILILSFSAASNAMLLAGFMTLVLWFTTARKLALGIGGAAVSVFLILYATEIYDIIPNSSGVGGMLLQPLHQVLIKILNAREEFFLKLLEYDLNHYKYNSGNHVILKSYLKRFVLIFFSISAVPQLGIPKIGGLGLGGFRGDLRLKFFGSDITLAFTSAIMVVSAWDVVQFII